MDINAEIIPGTSLGGMCLLDDALEIVNALHEQWDIQETQCDDVTFLTAPGIFSIRIRNSDVKIDELLAYPGYAGKLWGYIFPGMTFRSLIEHSSSQRVRNFHIAYEALVLNAEGSVGFYLPPMYDYVDYIRDIPEELPLEELYVRSPTQLRYKDKHKHWKLRPIHSSDE